MSIIEDQQHWAWSGIYTSFDWLYTLREQSLNGSLERLEPNGCIRKYAQDYLSDRGNLILVPRQEDELNQTQLTILSPASFIDVSGGSHSTLTWICAQDMVSANGWPTRSLSTSCVMRAKQYESIIRDWN